MAVLFANNAEAVMGSTEDPPDGGAVARTCIGAVIVYSVIVPVWRILTTRYSWHSAAVKYSCTDGVEELN